MGIADLGVKRCKGRGGKADCQAAFPDLCAACKAGTGMPDLMLALERSLQTSEGRNGRTAKWRRVGLPNADQRADKG